MNRPTSITQLHCLGFYIETQCLHYLGRLTLSPAGLLACCASWPWYRSDPHLPLPSPTHTTANHLLSNQSVGWPRALRWPRLVGPAHRGNHSIVCVLRPPDEDLVSCPKTSLQCLDCMVCCRFCSGASLTAPACSERRPYKVQSDNLFRAASEKSQRSPMSPALFRSLESCQLIADRGSFQPSSTSSSSSRQH